MEATPHELTAELAEKTRELVRALGPLVPERMIPGWVGGAVVTALVEELQERS